MYKFLLNCPEPPARKTKTSFWGPYKIVFSRCQIRVQESARMHDFALFTTELLGALRAATKHPAVQQLHFVQLVNLLCGLKGHFMLWRATRLRNLGVLLATY
jgi:hypothetical protein